MSNSKSKSVTEQKLPIKNIEVGKFYLIHDGSKTGHPGLIIWKNDEHNLYLVLKFGTTRNKDNVPFPYPIGVGIGQSYYYKRPFLAKRKNIRGKAFEDLRVNESDIRNILKKIDLNNPMCSTDITGRSLHSYLYYIKKSPPIGL